MNVARKVGIARGGLQLKSVDRSRETAPVWLVQTIGPEPCGKAFNAGATMQSGPRLLVAAAPL